jgi:hypothetical protein
VELQWASQNDGSLTAQYVPECTHQVVHLRPAARTGNASGRGLPKASLPRTPGPRPGFHPPLPPVGSGTVSAAGAQQRDLLSLGEGQVTARQRGLADRTHAPGVRTIAKRMHRAPSTISRELRRNAATRGGYLDYRALTAQSRPIWFRYGTRQPILHKVLERSVHGEFRRFRAQCTPIGTPSGK